MEARLIINEVPEVLIKDIAEGFVKGNHTFNEYLDLMEYVTREMSLKAE